jgi:hypothetical protein
MTQRLQNRRDELIEQLLELAPQILIGSVSETYRTCGNPNCRCHGEGPKHGPHMYVSYKGEHGRTTGYYVPAAMHERVRGGLDAWSQFHERAKLLAQLNKALMDAERPKKARRKRT